MSVRQKVPRVRKLISHFYVFIFPINTPKLNVLQSLNISVTLSKKHVRLSISEEKKDAKTYMRISNEIKL